MRQQTQQFQSCITACMSCAQVCEMCASACLTEQKIAELADCIRLNQDCATLCFAAAQLMTRGSEYAQALCKVCADICDACGAECAKHQMGHCQTCAQACKACGDECRKMAQMSVERRTAA